MNNVYIYLVFSKTGTWLSKLIYVFSGIKYAHTSISFDASFTKMYSFGRTNPNNPFSGGFVIENINEGVFKKFPQCECKIYKVPVKQAQLDTLQERINEFIVEQDNMKYNFWGLLGILINLPLYRKNYYFCSQFVSEVLMDCNIFKCEKEPELVKTSELLEITNKELVYEGFINNRVQCSRFQLHKPIIAKPSIQ